MMAPDMSNDVSGAVILSCDLGSANGLAVTLLNADFGVSNIESFLWSISVFKPLWRKGLKGSKALHGDLILLAYFGHSSSRFFGKREAPLAPLSRLSPRCLLMRAIIS